MEAAHPRCEPGVALCAEAWRMRRQRSGLDANLRRAGMPEETFWERYGAWVSTFKGSYPGALLDRVTACARAGDTVLDIGAGTGVFALPLARMARSVTAVEPSPSQVRQLHEAVAREAAANVSVVEARWEDVDIDTLGAHDLVLAIHSLQMDDIDAALRKMCRAARHCLLIVHPVGNSLSAVLRDLFGIEPGPDCGILPRLLAGLGYRPEVQLVDYSYDVPLDTQLDILHYNPGLNAGQCEALSAHAVDHGMIVERDGVLWLRRSCTDALVLVRSG